MLFVYFDSALKLYTSSEVNIKHTSHMVVEVGQEKIDRKQRISLNHIIIFKMQWKFIPLSCLNYCYVNIL